MRGWCSRAAGRIQPLRPERAATGEDDKDESPHDSVQRDRHAVLARSGQPSLSELLEHDLGETGVGVAAEPRVRQLGKGGLAVEAVEGPGAEEPVE